MTTSKTKPKGLGRGLDALFGCEEDVSFNDVPSTALREVELSQLHPGQYQPRRNMNEEALRELAQSIQSQGLICPIVVREDTVKGGYEIIAGERRFRALNLLGQKTTEVLVKDFDDQKTLAVALIENLQREDLNPIEEAMGIKRLIQEFNYTHEEAAQAIGRSRTATTNSLRLLTLTDEVKAMLAQGDLSMGHARALLPLEGAKQIELAKETHLKGYSVRQVEELVRRLLEDAPKVKKRVVIKTGDDLMLEETLADTLGAVVKLQANKKGKGKLVIEFSNLEQLQGIVEHIRK